jgi:hypothetical protein
MKKLLVLAIVAMMSLSGTVMAKEDKILDLRLVDMGYRWVQNIEDSSVNTSRVFTTFGVTKKDYIRFGWNRQGINQPFSANGNDTVMFQWTHKFGM